MTRRITRDPIYRCRHFSAETIELCVRWYITYRLSYRDLAAMMAEREIVVSHTTIEREVLARRTQPWAAYPCETGSAVRAGIEIVATAAASKVFFHMNSSLRVTGVIGC